MKAGVVVETGEIRNQCFVIMPFAGLFQSQYERVIKPAIEASGLVCVRGDEIFAKPQIMADIWKTIRQSRIVIAELSGKNANVFYELGLAHAIGKPAIIVTRSESDVPFDLKALRYLYYNTDDPFWGENLARSVTEMIKLVLSEEQFGSGLEGIELTDSLTLPARPKKPIESVPRAPGYDISGTWETRWTSTTTVTKTEVSHDAVINLSQKESQVTGSMTVSAPYKGDIVVVHEVLVGSVSDGKISLQGVSYSFLRRGDAETYVLNNFALSCVDEDLLKGTVVATHKRDSIDVELKRVTIDEAAI